MIGKSLLWQDKIWWKKVAKCQSIVGQFSVHEIEYPLGGSSKNGSHIYFLLIVAMVLLLWHQIVLLWHHVTMVASEQHLYQIVQFDKTIVLPRKLATGSIHDYLLLLPPSGYSIWGTEICDENGKMYNQ